MSLSNRKRILMLAPENPSQDPRIHWEASFAAKNFDVVVLGLQSRSRNAPEKEERDGYSIRRREEALTPGNRFHFFFHLFSLFSRSFQLLFALMFVILTPVLLLFEICIKILRFLLTDTYISKIYIKLIKVKLRILCPNNIVKDLIDCLWYIDFTAMITKVFLQEISDLPKKPDLIHCNDIFTLLAGLIAKKKCNCKVVYDTHEYTPYQFVEGTWLKTLLFKLYEGFLIKRVDSVITVNPLLASMIAKDYKLPKIISVPNAAPWIETQRRAILKEMTQLADGRVKFVFQGGYMAGRGIEEIIHAWLEIDPYKAALFFRGPPGPHKEEYMRLANRLGLIDKSVYFLESVRADDLVEAASEADIGLIPYKPIIKGHTYACPNKLSQYMHAGLMVVCNTLPYVRQILEESRAGLIYDSSNLIDILSFAIEEPEYREACKQNALLFAKNHFNWQKAYEPLEKIYLECSSS